MRLIKIFLSFFILGFFLVKKVFAVCPICVVTVGAGLGFSRWLGVDDSITGLWFGGLILALSLWTKNLLNKKNINFFGLTFLVNLIYLVLTILPLYYFNIINKFTDNLFGILGLNRFIFGIIFGSIFFYFGVVFNNFLKYKNKGRVYFRFQKVILPILILVILSLIFYIFL